eukprot:Lankesteria_metandrocarpae@DN3456_c0_g1_i2.p1
MGSQTSRTQVLTDLHRPSGIPGLPPAGAVDSRTVCKDTVTGKMEAVEGRGDVSTDGGANFDAQTLIPCVFTWTHGGRNVFLTGSFTNWSMDHKIKLARSGQEFSAIKELSRGVHQYKFIVDDHWRFAPDQATVSDEHGNINNVLDISKYMPLNFAIPTEYEMARETTYHRYIHDVCEYTSDAPLVPTLLIKSSCAAVEPPPKVPPFLQAMCQHVYHDSWTSQTFGEYFACVAATHRWRDDDGSMDQISQRFTTNLYVTSNPFLLSPLGSSQAASAVTSTSAQPFDIGTRPFRSIFTRPTEVPQQGLHAAAGASTLLSDTPSMTGEDGGIEQQEQQRRTAADQQNSGSA